MNIKDIRAIEDNRDGMMNVVHLIREGNFYRAHDWSAWLLANYPIGFAKEEPLRVTAKKLKDGYIDTFVGFPVTSIGKFVPDEDIAKFDPVSDEQIDVTMTVDFADTPADDVRARVDEWKNSLPLTQDKKDKRENREAAHDAPRVRRVSDVMSYIVSLDMSEISPADAYRILRQLRHQISEFF